MRKSQISIKKSRRPINYGHQRFIGAFGIMAGVTMMNASFDVFPRGVSITCYTSIFPIYIVLTFCYIVSAMFLYKGLSFEDDRNEQNENREPTLNNHYDKDTEKAENNVKEYNMRDRTNEEAATDDKPMAITTENIKCNDKRVDPDQKEYYKMKDEQTEKNYFANMEKEMEEDAEKHDIDQYNKQSYKKTLRRTLVQFDTIFFYLTVLVVGFINTPFTLFLYVRLKELGATTSIFSLSFVISASTAAVGFFYSTQLIKMMGGPLRTILITIIVFALRLFSVAAATEAWMVLPCQVDNLTLSP